MTQTQIKRATREAKGVPDKELAGNLKFFISQRQKAAVLGYSDAILLAQFDQQIAIWTAELERRENGGKLLADIRQPYISDGERLALGLPEKADNA